MRCVSLLLVLGVVAGWPSARSMADEWDGRYHEAVADWPVRGAIQPVSVDAQIPPEGFGYQLASACTDAPRPRRPCCRPVWEAGFELTMLKPRFEDGAEEEWQGDVVDFDLRPGPRVWLSRATPDGWTLRARYWQFDHASEPRWVTTVPGPRYRVFADVKADTVDLELAQKWKLGCWSLLVGGGARYVTIQQSIQATETPDRWFKRLDAIGPTFALEGQRVTRLSCFSVFANFRGSLLSGKARWASPGEVQDTDDIGSILEMQIGGELKWQFCRRGALFLRSGWEQQVWLGAGSFFSSAGVPAGEILDIHPDDHDLGFMGFFVSLGANW
jgi:hypothetical protein